jgi:hypothetical protein
VNGDNLPWDSIGWWLTSHAVARMLRRHWRFLASGALIFVAYQYVLMAYHYLVSLL